MIGSRGVVEDEAIATVLRLYIEGSANGDAAKLREAFHEHARVYGSLEGTRHDLALDEMVAMEERSPRDRRRGLRGPVQANVPTHVSVLKPGWPVVNTSTLPKSLRIPEVRGCGSGASCVQLLVAGL